VTVSPAPKSNIIAVASGKGGVGKTWFAVTLAQSFAEAGKRTLLFDGDLGLANIDIQLGLIPNRDLGHYSSEMKLHRLITPYPAGPFDIIAGRSGSGALAAMDPARLAAMTAELVTLADDYDRVILDLGAGIEGAVRALSGIAGTRLVVTSDEPTSLTDAYAYIKLSKGNGLAPDIRVVVNMASSARDGERTYATLSRACNGFLKFTPKLAGVVRRDPKVPDAIRAQAPLLTRHPTADAAADVRSVARGLLAG
jgi:flagellar biosynthesis protein FlhG